MKKLCTLFLILGFQQIALAQNCLIANFELTGNALDNSGNNHNGSIVGSPQLISGHNNMPNSAYEFGMNDRIDVNNTLGNFGTGAFSISLWIKYDTLPTIVGHPNVRARIVSKRNLCGSAAASGPFYTLNLTTDGEVVLEASDGTFSYEFSNGEFLNDDQWHHIVLVRDGMDYKVFVDNIQTLTHTTTFVHDYTNSAPLHFAYGVCVGNASVAKYTGAMDNIKYFNCALGTSKIDSLYNYDFPLNLESKVRDNSIKIFPNPSKDIVQIDFGDEYIKGDYEIAIVDLLGAKKMELVAENRNLKLNLNQLATGIHFIRIVNLRNGDAYTHKLVKK